MSAQPLRSHRLALPLAGAALVALVAAAALVPDAGTAPARPDARAVPAPAAVLAAAEPPSPPAPPPAPVAETRGPQGLPHDAPSIFGDNRFLVAYYGTAGTGALGVLGETDPDQAFTRLQQAAAPFARRRSAVQPVFELIVTIADASAGPDGDYSHDIAREQVQRYIDAAHRHDALLLLDLQPGRSSFLDVARRWRWALADAWVGLALDPEWRLGPHGVPAQRIGSVGAPEVNRTAAWLHDLVRRKGLPQKLFVLHQFRTDMIRDIDRIKPRGGLVMVQHVDGFGTPGQKLDTFHTVARPGQFRMGFKLFYDEDVHRMSAADVRRIRPQVRFVSFQ